MSERLREEGNFKEMFGIFFVAVDFTINVLSSGSWPFQQGPPFALSIEVYNIDCNLCAFKRW